MSGMSALPDVCRGRHGGSAESEAANRRVHRAKYELRSLLYHFVLHRGGTGATCEEASRELGMRYTTASARLSELKADGWLEPTGERRKTAGGSSAAVLRALTETQRARKLAQRSQGRLFQ